MKPTSLSLPVAVIALLTAAVFAFTTVAQNPQAPQPQVHEIMHGWADALGTHCGTCHAADPNNIGPNGRPRLKYADDSKPEKATARLMFSMTEDINKNYVSKVPNSDASVTCGTCHRGHLEPEPFVAPPEDHDGPRPAQGAPQGPPTGTAPPTSH